MPGASHRTHKITSGPAAAHIGPGARSYFSFMRNGERFDNVYAVIDRHERRGECHLMTGTFPMGGEVVPFKAIYYPNRAEEVMGELATELNLSLLKAQD